MNTYLDRLENVVLLFNNPVYTGESVSSTVVRNLTALSSDLAYTRDVTQNLTVLSDIYSTTYNGLLQGLLYVPDLKKTDPCAEYERAYVPDTAVRQSDLPHTNYNLIALAPWFNDSCTQSYLESVHMDTLRALIFYLPGTGFSLPPDAKSDVWTLGGDFSWRNANHFPVFAISGALGTEMMFQLSRYSGNVSDVPNGRNISALYGPGKNDYVRIWTQLTVRTPSGLPHVWGFLLVILGVVLIVCITITLSMRLLWQRRRLMLQRRVVAGEVNLEALSVKRLVVPMYYVEKFPLFIYNNYPLDPPALNSPAATVELAVAAAQERVGLLTPLHSKEMGSTSPAPVMDYQPMCQICLDEFQNHVTVIRELPCGHIFHPECIDEFLSQMSSLCPLCKTSMLPLGYCPPITNAMVRRERAVQRLRARVVVEDSDDDSVPVKPHRWRFSANRYLLNSHRSPAIELERRASQREVACARMHFLAAPDMEQGDAGASEHESWVGRLYATWVASPFSTTRTAAKGPPRLA